MDLMDFYGRDGTRLAYQETGSGRPLILIHGHQDRGSHWVDSGLAGRLAERGYRVIMPDDALHGRHVEVPGDHFTAEQSPEFYRALTEFLAS